VPRTRNYKAEYARRLQRGRERGLSRSISRGHPSKRIGEIGIARSRAMLLPRPVSVIRTRDEVRHGYRPSYAAIRRRAKSLNLHFTLEILKGKRGKIGEGFDDDGDMTEDETRDEFVYALTSWGFTAREAYTLWFSP